jgi:glycosyltransferase involved in cell wall biosynthesis
MACGIPVVCSDSSSLPEIGGDAVLTFKPQSTSDIAAKMITVLTNPELRQQMIQKGLERTRLFSWKRHADKLLELVKK